MIRSVDTEILVLGAGIAGLEAAYTAAKAGKKVLVVSKGAQASASILGFCAPVAEDDSAELFGRDTYFGGWEIGEPELVKVLSKQSRETVHHMEALGLAFDRLSDENRAYQLLQPLGCSVPRLVKHKNTTGKASMAVLKDACLKLGVRFIEHAEALELIMADKAVCGAVCMYVNTNEPFAVQADAVVMATGGAHLMKNSTYPMDQTADGMAMAYHAGASLIDLEFIQHEPCRAVWPKPLGLSTTLLAKGGILTNRLGERFVLKYYPTEGAAPKDMLARLIAIEVSEGRGSDHGGVYLDLTGIPENEIKEKHILYYERFLNAGIDLTKDVIEVGPAAHSMMGGIEISPDCSTGVPGLFAAGEVTGGLHGANRLGGNAGAEVYVFGRVAGKSAAAYQSPLLSKGLDLSNTEQLLKTDSQAERTDYEAERTAAREIMAKAMGPVRDGKTLEEAICFLNEQLKRLRATPVDSMESVRLKTETCHMVEIAGLACRSALIRTESRGVHFRSDHPEQQDPEWKKHIRACFPDAEQISHGGRYDHKELR